MPDACGKDTTSSCFSASNSPKVDNKTYETYLSGIAIYFVEKRDPENVEVAVGILILSFDKCVCNVIESW